MVAWGKKHKLMIGNKITINEEVLNPTGSNIFVQNDDAAHKSSKRQVTDYRYEAGPAKINKPQQNGANGCATHARCCLLVLMGGSFLTLCSLRVGCAHDCVHESAKQGPNIYLWVWSARMMCTYFLGFAQKGCVNSIIEGMRKPNPWGMRKHHPRECCGNPGFAKAQNFSKACHARHTARIAPKPPATRPQRSNCAHSPPTFRIEVRSRRDVSVFFFTTIRIHMQGARVKLLATALSLSLQVSYTSCSPRTYTTYYVPASVCYARSVALAFGPTQLSAVSKLSVTDSFSHVSSRIHGSGL